MTDYERKMVSEALRVKIRRVEGNGGRISFVTESNEAKPDEVEKAAILSAYRSSGSNIRG